MKLETSHPSLALYRLVKGGDGGLGLSLGDLHDRRIELSFLGLKVTGVIKALPKRLIDKLLVIQKHIDDKIKEEMEKAKRDV